MFIKGIKFHFVLGNMLWWGIIPVVETTGFIPYSLREIVLILTKLKPELHKQVSY
jgi:hypothetical protein